MGARGRFVSVVALALVFASGCVMPELPPPYPDVETVIVGPQEGFGGGTIYFPKDHTGRLPVVAASPGFLGDQGSVAWYGPLLARESNIVITIETLSPYDPPAARARELLAAVDYVVRSSAVANFADSSRTAVMGHSMGGGGSLDAGLLRPTLRAIVPLAPWNPNKDFSSLRVPALIVGCQNDVIAPVGQHAEVFYESVPTTTPKAYLEIAGGEHACTASPNDTVARYVVAWVSQFVKGDTSAGAVLCPPPRAGGSISEYRANCPY